MFALLKRYFLRRNPKGKYSSSTRSAEQKTAELRIEQGNSLWEQEQNRHRQLTKTTASYRQAIQLSDNSAQAYQKLAEALKQEGNLEEAAFFYRQAIALNASASGNKVSKAKIILETLASKGNQITVVNLSNLPLAPQSVNGNTNDQPKTAMAQLKDLRLNGNDSGSSNYSQKPTILPQLLKGSTNDRQTSLAQSSNLAPELQPVNSSTNNYQTPVPQVEAVKVYLQQAEAYCAQKKWELAIAACKRALQIAPKMAEAYKIWGNTLQRMGQAAEAMGYYAKALEIQPDLAEVHANLGSLYAKQQEWQQAIDYYQKAVAINPKFPGVYRNLAKVWIQVGQPQKATECTYQALTLEPGKASPEAHFDLGNELWQQSRFSEAIACYRRAIEFNPNFVKACQKLADALAQQGEWKESNTYYRKVLELNAAEAAIGLDKQGKQRKQGGRGRENRANPNSIGLPQLNGEKKVQGLLKASAQEMKQLMAASEVALLPSQSKGATGINARKTLGKPLDDQGKVEAAIQRYIKIAKAQPDSAEVHANLGSLYAQQQKWQQAIACYKKALQLNPKLAGVYRNLAKVLSQTGKSEAATQSWYQALTLEPNRAKAEEHFNLGNTLLEQGKLEQAVVCYRRAIQLKPSCSQAYHRLGEILTEQGQVQEAYALYRQAVERNPQDAESYYCLGQALAAQEEWEKAIAYYRKATEVQPKLWQADHQLGEALSKQQQWKEAVAAYRRAAELNPDFPWSRHNLGYALLQLERWREAESAFRRAIELKPDSPWSHYNLGEALVKQKEWDEAIAAYRSALKLQLDWPEAEQKLNNVLHQRAKADLESVLSSCRQAIQQESADLKTYHKALEIQPNNAEFYFGLAKALERRGEPEQAIVFIELALQQKPDAWQEALETYAQVMKVKPDSPLVKQKLSECYRSLAQFSLQKALANYRLALQFDPNNLELYHQALAVNPNNPELYFSLAKTLVKQGKRNEAIAIYKKGLELDPDHAEMSARLDKILSLPPIQEVTGINPQADEIKFKIDEGKDESNWKFDWEFYLQSNEDLSYISSYEEAYDHWVTHGKSEGRIASEEQFYETHGLTKSDLPTDFNWQEYLELNPGLKSSIRSEEQAIRHFIVHGAKEERIYSFNQLYYKPRQAAKSETQNVELDGNEQLDPDSQFDWNFYVEYNEDLSNLSSYEEAHAHWLKYGKQEGRIFSKKQLYEFHGFKNLDLPADFDWQEYVALHLDLQSEITTKWKAIQHYITIGIKEERIYSLEQLHKGPQVAERSVIRNIDVSTTSSEVQRLAVLVHIYYFDLWREIWHYLNNIEEEFDLFINVVESVWTPLIHNQLRKDAPDAKILITKNRGRDIGGFLALMGHLDFDKYDVLCFLHTKKSPHISKLISDQWRIDLLTALLGTKEKAKTNLEIMRKDPSIGLLGSRYWRNTEVLNNTESYYKLLKDFEIKPEARDCEYLSGTMMFVRPQIMKPIYDKYGDFELEDGDGKDLSFHMDGQIAHGIERLIGNLVKHLDMYFFWQD